MITYTYNHVNYTDFLHGFAEAVGTKLKNNKFTFPPAAGSGYIKLLLLPEGLQAVVSDYTLADELTVFRKKSNEEFYNLRFEEFFVPGNLVIEINEEVMREKDKVHAGAKLFNTLFDTGYTLSKGTKLKNISILISKEWMASHLGLSSSSEVLQQYIALKTAGFNIEPFDSEYRSLFNEILEDHKDDPLQKTLIQNRIMKLIEKFFTNLSLKKMDLEKKFHITLSHKEIDKLMQVESILIKDFSVPPPTIAELAKNATMSPSKLKSSFKQVYGSGLYEYYQKVRMQKARSLLLSRKYSVKEVGKRLGYTNLSNFALAFKKQFNILPSKV